MARWFQNPVRIAHSVNFFHSVRETPGTHRSGTATTVRSWWTVQWNGSYVGGWRDDKQSYPMRWIALIEQPFWNLAGRRDRLFCERPSLDAHVETGFRPVNFIMLATKLLDFRR